jgi:hypothetical protein
MGLKTKEKEPFLKHIRGGHDRVSVEGTLSYNSISDLYVWTNEFLEKCRPEECDIEPPRCFEEDEFDALLDCYERIKRKQIGNQKKEGDTLQIVDVPADSYFTVAVDPNNPKSEIQLRVDGNVVGRIVNVKPATEE